MEDPMEGTSWQYNQPVSTRRTRIRERFSLNINAEGNKPVDLYNELLNLTWNIFGVSILFNFYQDEIHLKQYGKRLREVVARTLSKENVTYHANFSIMEDVTARPSPSDPPPIKIEVHAAVGNEEINGKCIFTGILLSWKTRQSKLTTTNTARLPLLLCRGTKSCMKVVQNVLSLMFDCTMSALSAQGDDLMWLVSIVIAPTDTDEPPKDTDEACMKYIIPELPDTDTISVKFPIVQLVKILTVIIKDQSDDVSDEITLSLEHVEKFRDVLYAHMLKCSNLQLGLCLLNEICLPAITIKEHRMKVMKADTLDLVLSYLNEKALGTFHTISL